MDAVMDEVRLALKKGSVNGLSGPECAKLVDLIEGNGAAKASPAAAAPSKK